MTTTTAVGLLAILAAYAMGLLYGRRGLRRTNRALASARREARTDELTGLTNRAGLRQALQVWAAGRSPYAVLLLDLDGFKAVNDAYGHAAGDAVLVEVARRLSTLIPGDGLVARLSGDEFVLVASSPGGVVSRLLAWDTTRAISRPVDVDGTPVTIGVSVGVVQAWPGDDPRALLRAADIAMYQAKTTAAGVCEFDPLGGLPAPDLRPVVRLQDLTGLGRGLHRGHTTRCTPLPVEVDRRRLPVVRDSPIQRREPVRGRVVITDVTLTSPPPTCPASQEGAPQ